MREHTASGLLIHPSFCEVNDLEEVDPFLADRGLIQELVEVIAFG